MSIIYITAISVILIVIGIYSFVDIKRNNEELKYKQNSISPYVWGESIKIKGDKNV
jgi:hypothetical protein|tara:strand:- start:21 stop:188 length:168 start_codon:yes stop_codon:yes gene_type:complete